MGKTTKVRVPNDAAVQSGDEERVRRATDDLAERLDRHRCGGARELGNENAKAATISSVTSLTCWISTSRVLLGEMRMKRVGFGF